MSSGGNLEAGGEWPQNGMTKTEAHRSKARPSRVPFADLRSGLTRTSSSCYKHTSS